MRLPLVVPPGADHLPFEREEVEGSIGARFRRVAHRFPDRAAVREAQRVTTYAELSASAGRIARGLTERLAAEPGPVVLLCDAGASLFAAMLGALEAGRFYVPLDPGLPAARLAAILRTLDAAAVVAGEPWIDLARRLAVSEPVLPIAELDAGPPAPAPAARVLPDDLAYVLFTSGSTGVPKGVMQSHRNLLHNARKLATGLAIRADDRLTLLSSPSFGASVSSIYGALLTGACVCPYALAGDGLRRLPEFLSRERITILHSVPSVFRCFSWTLDGREDLSALRVVKLGGEAVLASDFELYGNRFPRRCVFHVGLGATEMHVIRQWFADHDTPWPGASPLGHAVDETEVVLLDDAGRPAEEEGEIAVVARTLAVGYWKDPGETAAAFLPVPGRPGVRMFRTGDLGRMLPDGCLLYVGRKGSRLKIRGHRVEVGEVEDVLLKVAGIREAVVDAVGRAERPRLVAWIAREGGSLPSVEAIRAALSGALPAYMVPQRVRVPRTAAPHRVRQGRPAGSARSGRGPAGHRARAGVRGRGTARWKPRWPASSPGPSAAKGRGVRRLLRDRRGLPLGGRDPRRDSPRGSASSSPPRTCSKRRRPRRSAGRVAGGARSCRTPSCASVCGRGPRFRRPRRRGRRRGSLRRPTPGAPDRRRRAVLLLPLGPAASPRS